MNTDTVIEMIKQHEGFRGDPYIDTLGFSTIGFGTKLPLSEDEAVMILKKRLIESINTLDELQPIFSTLPGPAQEIIANMVYQMGVRGVMNFKKMWTALSHGDYKEAAAQMRDSRWHTQTSNRAEHLALMMEELA